MLEKENFPTEKENEELKVSRIKESINKLAAEKKPDEQNRIIIEVEEIENEVADDSENIIDLIKEAINSFKAEGIEISYDQDKKEIILANEKGIDIEVIEEKGKETEINQKELEKVFSIIENKLATKGEGRHEINIILENEQQEILKKNLKEAKDKLSEMINDYLKEKGWKKVDVSSLEWSNSSNQLSFNLNIE